MVPRPLACLGATVGLLFGLATEVTAQVPLHQRIDALIAAGSPDFDSQVALNASDAEFLRRISLDLTSVIPSAAEARAFLANPSTTKRQQLIDRLLASPGYAWHMQHVFD